MNKPSLKKTIIKNIIYSVEANVLKDNAICVITPTGSITGTVMIKTEDFDNLSNREYITQLFPRLLNKWGDEYDKKYLSPDEKELENNDGYFILENATIHSVPKINLPFLIIFYDQIIGITIGNFD